MLRVQHKAKMDGEEGGREIGVVPLSTDVLGKEGESLYLATLQHQEQRNIAIAIITAIILSKK